MQTIIDNSSWLLGNGDSINFWLDDWCGGPLVHMLNIPPYLHQNLHAYGSDFIRNSQWRILLDLQNMFPSLLQHVTSAFIPLSLREDEFSWKHNTSGTLSMKEAFQFISPIGTQRNWAKLIWNTVIPPSKSFLIWRAI